MADGVVATSHVDNHLFRNGDPSAVITFFLDVASTISSFSIFGGDTSANNIPGNITGVDVTIGGQTATISTTAFGQSSSDADLVNDLGSLVGTGLELISTTSITLSNWTISGQGADYYNISEFTVDAAPVSAIPVPASLPLLMAGLGGIAALRRRKNKS